MDLAIVVIGIIALIVYLFKELLTPPAPPIDDMEEHLKYLSSLPDQKARQRYLKHRKPGDK